MLSLDIGRRRIGDDQPTYFIADISANHDGDLERAKMLIQLCARAGADAAKFQNFRAPKIVSEQGFRSLSAQLSHQAKWKKSVYQVYQEASLPWEWTPVLKAECDRAGIEYSSTPYDFDAVDMLDPYVAIYKIGSGDITWPEMLRKVASKNKPVLLACGASDIGEVKAAVDTIRAVNPRLGLMQCNTNYTASLENFRHIHLNVLRTFRTMFPDLVLGLSDHTPGHATVLGAVALGARVVEKHFTDDNAREGPDHPFSMTPATWREMVDRTRELELALGSAEKKVAGNEQDTVVVQRRCLRAARNLEPGTLLTRDCLDVLRPAPRDAIFPYEIDKVIGMRLRARVEAGQHLRWTMLEGEPKAAGQS
ncbi:MAG TPA: N-acetylneuraminate synthase family protein [Terriglobales bacterium]|nr:N-acetylneuraminate synthase family protein [Terriglobales bacterium]